ncbi:crotonase/enoyl-CoA hydratase family protein [Jiella pelagia]|uniref:Crotonase/enoyl-CoA hydratase family protein n=1 Tax=Jiella pelagia TaxID=2986949 RepID=A0ABY7C5Q2_9HYPH|nr:crotonase/enoyl-CoA hydratase family protein [Jiella pelagia]WAP70551.1 crotonase/enoyl-CoA hydratase family protein [Jiella pelagia]
MPQVQLSDVNYGDLAASCAASQIVDRITDRTGPLPQLQLMFEEQHRLLWLVMHPEPKPVFTLPLVDSVLRVQEALRAMVEAGEPMPVEVIAYRTAGPAFSLGGDLDYYLDCLARRDREGLVRYAETACAVIAGNLSGLGGHFATIAAVHGRALGGGIDPARACHVMVAEESATFCYPEINYNHFPIAAAPILARRIGAVEAERMLLSGHSFTAEEFYEKGAVEAVVGDGGSAMWVRDFCRKSAGSRRSRIAIATAFNRMAPDLTTELHIAGAAWVEHMLALGEAETTKLQRIVQAQKRLLDRAG